MTFTAQDYDQAIEALQSGRSQLEPDGRICAVCGDSGHQAFECRHNPLVMMRRAQQKEHEWRCFHCGQVFTTPEAAEAHFGKTELDGPAACQCW